MDPTDHSKPLRHASDVAHKAPKHAFFRRKIRIMRLLPGFGMLPGNFPAV
jgi:hypothetical protein